LDGCASGRPAWKSTFARPIWSREFAIAPDSYDLICDILYLQRDMFDSIREGLRPEEFSPALSRCSGPNAILPSESRPANFAGIRKLEDSLLLGNRRRPHSGAQSVSGPPLPKTAAALALDHFIEQRRPVFHGSAQRILVGGQFGDCVPSVLAAHRFDGAPGSCDRNDSIWGGTSGTNSILPG